MRPKALAYFEHGTIALMILGAVQGFAVFVLLHVPTPISFGVILAITYLVAYSVIVSFTRRRSKIAMWLFIVVMVPAGLWTLWDIFYDWKSYSVPITIIILASAIETLLQFALIGLLFTPNARRWMNHEDDRLPEIFS